MRPFLRIHCLLSICLYAAAAQAQMPVIRAVELLDSALQQQAVVSIALQETSNTAVPVFLLEDIQGRTLDLGAQGTGQQMEYGKVVSSIPLSLIHAGKYMLDGSNVPEGLVLQYGRDIFPLASGKQVYVEHAPLWIRIFTTPRESDGIIIWKTDALDVLVQLVAISRLVEQTEIPLSVERWRTIFIQLEENPFFRTQLGALRLTELPSAHPLLPEVAEKLNAQCTLILDTGTPTTEIILKRPEPTAAYFSLQDMEKNYGRPVIADATEELRSAGNRMEANRGNSGLNATALAAGLTDFVLERAKEEFSISFLERMQHNIGAGGKFKELGILFPQTANFLTGKANLSRYKSLLPTARDYFLQDMRTLGLQVHRLLELEPYNALQNTGGVYNLALFYDITSMAVQGMSLDTLLGNIFSRLELRQSQLFLQGNRDLAKNTAAQDDLAVLQASLDALNTDLDALSKDILRKNIALEAVGFLDLEMAAAEVGKEALAAYATIYRDYLDGTARRDQRLLLWLAKDRHEQLRNIPLQLQGRRYYEQLLRYPKLETYSQYFSKSPDSIQLIASGIELSKKLVYPLPGVLSMPDFLVDYSRYLQGVEGVVAEKTAAYLALSPQALEERRKRLDGDRVNLGNQLDVEIAYWKSQNQRKLEDHIAALSFLRGALQSENDADWDIPSAHSPEQMQQALQKSEDRLRLAVTWVLERLDSLESGSELKRPIRKILQQQLRPQAVNTPLLDPEVEGRLQRILLQSTGIRAQLERMDEQYIRALKDTREEALLMENVVEMSAQLLACLQVVSAGEALSTKRTYIRPGDFWEMMRRDRSRDLFLGIVQQRLQQVSVNSRLSPRSVATITAKFVDIAYQAEVIRDSLRRRSTHSVHFADYFPIVRLGMDMLSTLIQNPLIEGDTLFKRLGQVPLVTGEAIALFENVHTERYGNAVHNVVEVFRLLSNSSDSSATRWQELRKDILLYGSFMANVAVAKTAEDVKGALLAASVPPGSSRVKREERFNVALNTYLGIAVGQEGLRSASAVQKTAQTVGLSLPVGISVSWKFKETHATSFSVLLSALDLGAVAAFRLGDANAGLLPDLKLDNFIAPGAFVLLNLPRSPFSVGMGSQYGPRTRTITAANGLESQSAAWRWLFFAGIDIPVFSLATQKTR